MSKQVVKKEVIQLRTYLMHRLSIRLIVVVSVLLISGVVGCSDDSQGRNDIELGPDSGSDGGSADGQITEDAFADSGDLQEPGLLSFSISPEHNAGNIQSTAHARIEGSRVEVWVSEGVDRKDLVAEFEFSGAQVLIDGVQQESGVTANDLSRPRTLSVLDSAGAGSGESDIEEVTYDLEVRELVDLKNVVPHIYISTDNGAAIDTKEEYLPGDLRIDGLGEYANFEGRMGIRGRGNSTWRMPKKPFKIKLDEKSELLGLAPAKKWILLANYIDGSLMSNAIAMKAGRLLEMPFTHHMIPVDVTVNGEYQGNYMFTEQKEVKKDRINIGDDGVLLELDAHFDEPYQFYSAQYDLPVMIQYPKLEKIDAGEANARMAAIKQDFEAFEALVHGEDFPESGYRDRFDIRSLADFLIVFYISANREINHPKSVYMYQKAGEPYRMGPIWDFDWAYGYTETDGVHYVDVEAALLDTGSSARVGAKFFGRFLEDPELREILQERWEYFQDEKYAALVDYLEGYAALIEDSYVRDYEVWGQGSRDQQGELERMFQWLEARILGVDDLAEAI